MLNFYPALYTILMLQSNGMVTVIHGALLGSTIGPNISKVENWAAHFRPQITLGPPLTRGRRPQRNLLPWRKEGGHQNPNLP